MAKLTHEEFDRQVDEAMQPQTAQAGRGFAPGLNRLRQAVRQPRPAPAQPPIPAS